MSQRGQSEAKAPTLLVSNGGSAAVSSGPSSSSRLTAGSLSGGASSSSASSGGASSASSGGPPTGRENTELVGFGPSYPGGPSGMGGAGGMGASSTAQTGISSSGTSPNSPGITNVAGSPGSTGAQRSCPTCGNRFPADFKVCPHDATPLIDAIAEEDGMIGATLGESYKIIRAIGEGGMGRVYEARHVRLPNKRYAVKVLHSEHARQGDTVMRFQREAEAASGIGHPNVITVFDVHVTQDGRPYMVSELLEGEDFGALLERVGRIDVTTAIRIVRPVCRALTAAHAHGVIHRDMKPENVFLSGPLEAPSVKLLDFGISKIAEPASGGAALTKTGIVMGTPAFMAPEQAMGLKVDPRADVYAVGAILYRALTGRRPFLATDVMTMLTAVMTEEPDRPRSIEPSIPEGLELVIQRAMAKEPADRFPSMDALDAALAPFDTVSSMIAPTSETLTSARHTERSAPTLAVDTKATTLVSQGLRGSRPTLVLTSVVGALWLVGVASDSGAALMRLIRGGSTVSTSESTLILVAVVAAVFTPLALWIRYLAQRVWPNSIRAMEVSTLARRTVTWSMVGFGIAALGIHLIVVLSLGDAKSMSLPVWHLITTAGALAGAAVAWLNKK